MSTYSLANSWLTALVRAVETCGIDPHDLLVGGLSTEDLGDPVNARIDHDSMTRLWKRAAALTGDPTIGLAAARFVGPATFGPLSFAMNASDSALTALKTMVRFNQVSSNAATWTFRQDEDYVDLTQHMRGPLGAWEQKDAVVAAVLYICRSLGDPSLRYEKLIIGRPAPRDSSPWTSYFSIEPGFQGNGVSFMRFRRTDVDKRSPTYEPELYELSVTILERKLNELNSASFLAQVESHIIEGIERGNVHIDLVSEKLGISRRTLQRRLLAENHCTYRSVFQSVRHSLADRYLRMTNRPIEEISDLLGYANVSGFSRGFRHRNGMTPTEYRRQRETG